MWSQEWVCYKTSPAPSCPLLLFSPTDAFCHGWHSKQMCPLAPPGLGLFSLQNPELSNLHLLSITQSVVFCCSSANGLMRDGDIHPPTPVSSGREPPLGFLLCFLAVPTGVALPDSFGGDPKAESGAVPSWLLRREVAVCMELPGPSRHWRWFTGVVTRAHSLPSGMNTKADSMWRHHQEGALWSQTAWTLIPTVLCGTGPGAQPL